MGKSFQPHINTGTFSYAVPLALPPAPGGFAPTVEITYNSGAGNSPLGPGWKLAPMQVIERQTEKGFSRYQHGDTFVFNGEELVPLYDGSYRLKNEGEFRRFTPLASQEGGAIDHWLIEDPNGVKHWLGSTAQSRLTLNNERLPQNHTAEPHRGLFDRTYAWYEDTAEDPSGNRIAYHYQTFPNSPNVLYLSQLRYHAQDQTDTAQVVQFYYESRPDALIDNRAGFAQTMGQRCREIAVYTRRTDRIERLRSYVLSYQPADNALDALHTATPAGQRPIDVGLSRLYAITQYDRHRNPDNPAAEPGTALPALRFAYAGLSFHEPPKGLRHALNPLDYRRRSHEPDPLRNGPQVRDMQQRGHEDQRLPIHFPLGHPAVQFVDLNGDGLPDLLNTRRELHHPAPEFALNEGDGRFGPTQRCDPPACNMPLLSLGQDDAPVLLADMTGNGLADLVQIMTDHHHATTRIFHNRHDPGVPERSTDPANPTNPLGFAFDQQQPLGVAWNPARIRQIDLNFDKRTDVLLTNDSGIQGYVFTPDQGWKDAGRQNWGQGFWQQHYRFDREPDPQAPEGQPLSTRNPWVHLADMNGDRLLDLVRLQPQSGSRLRVFYRPMEGFMYWGEERTLGEIESPGGFSETDNDALHLIDVNGDGLTDLVQIRRNRTVAVWFNGFNTDPSNPQPALLGPQFFSDPAIPAYQPEDEHNPTIVRALDLTGHGGTGLLFFHASGMDRGARYLDFMPGQKPGLLQVIDNGIGKRTFIRYRPSTVDLLRAQNRQAPWITTLPFPVWVVAGTVEDIGLDLNGDGEPDRYATSFDYRDGYYDGVERQFRGFAYAQQIAWGDDVNPDTGLPRGARLTGSGAPTTVTRYRFMTGAPDGVNNDEAIPTDDGAPSVADEFCDPTASTGHCRAAGRALGITGREEEPLKGKPVWQEDVDGGVLGAAEREADFDRCAGQTARAAHGDAFGSKASRCTPDTYVYNRVSSEWMIRPLYRPENTTAPGGRLRDATPTIAESVRWALLTATTTEQPEANGWLRQHFSDDRARVQAQDPVVTRQEYGYDDYGNRILERDLGVIRGREPVTGDERVTRRAFIIDTRGGNHSRDRRWFLNRPQSERVEDAEGRFARETRYFYDGPAFVGLPLGQLGARGLLSRTQQRVFDPASPAAPLTTTPATPEGLAALRVPGDPVNPDSPEWLDTERKQYDDYGNVIGLLDPLGQIQPNGEADLTVGHVRQLTYDPVFHALPVEERIHLGAGQSPLAVRVAYERPGSAEYPAVPLGFGVMTRSWDFNGHPTDYDYDSFGRLTAVVRPGDSAALPTTLYTYRMADPHRGRRYDYDRAGRLAPEGQPRPAPFHNTASSVQTDRRERSGEPGVLTQLAYVDGAGHALLRLEEDSTPGHFVVGEATRYGLRGTPIQRFQPYTVEGHGFALPKAGTVARHDLSYDAAGRLIRTLAPPETADAEAPRAETRTHYLPLSQWVFSEEALASADPAQSHRETPAIHHYDGLGRLIGVDEVVWNRGDERAERAETWRTRYGFDLNDHLVHIQDSQNNYKWLRYDGLGRKVFMNDPDRGEMRYRYDAAGNLVETQDAAGQRIAHAYDGVNRLIAETYHPAGQPPPTAPAVVYHHDRPADSVDTGQSAPRTASNTAGQLAWVADRSGEEHWSYDERGRVQWRVKRVREPGSEALVNFHFATVYDALDRAVRFQYPDGASLDYRYNPRGLLDGLALGETTTLVAGTDYQPSGQHAAIRYGNGVRTEFAYDPRLRLRSLDTRAPADQPLLAYRYAYDFNSNLLEIADARPPGDSYPNNSQRFRYDDRDRLIQVRYDPGGIDYRYDPIGNLIRQQSDLAHQERGQQITQLGVLCYGGQALTAPVGACEGPLGSGTRNRIGKGADPGPHALTATVNGAIEYDANGNTTHLEGQRLVWDVKNRLVQLETDQAIATYTYDYTDRRISKQVQPKPAVGQPSMPPATTTLYADRHYERRDGAPVYYAYQGDTRVAQWTGNLADLVIYHPDHLGSANVLTDTEGRVTEEYAYYPYGHPRVHVPPHAEGPRAAHYQFTQKERDAESGLQYFEARYYVGHLGRFISVDPLLSENPRPRATKEYPFTDLFNTYEINHYAYARNNPLNLNDPSGKFAMQVGGAIVGGVGGVVVRGVLDIAKWQMSPFADYAGVLVGGAAGGAAAVSCGPACAGSVASASANVTRQGINWFQGQAVSVWSFAVDTVLGGVVGIGASKIIPYAFINFSSSITKGKIGESLSWIGLTATRQKFETQVANGVRKSTFDFGLPNSRIFFESKFGTSSLSSPQREAAAILGTTLNVHYWNYPTVSGISATIGVSGTSGLLYQNKPNSNSVQPVNSNP